MLSRFSGISGIEMNAEYMRKTIDKVLELVYSMAKEIK